MQMDLMWWMVASVFCAGTTGGLVYFVMKSRTDVLLARQREKLAVAQAALGAQKEAMLDSVRHAAQETARREAMDDFMADIRIEERHYIREHKALFLTRKSVVRQERIFFRNLPLSNWIEQEMPFEEGADIDQLAKTMSVFMPEALLEDPEPKPRRLLQLRGCDTESQLNQYRRTSGSISRLHRSMPPAMLWQFSTPCRRSQSTTAKLLTP